jgi:hypothetical protein
MLDIPFCQFSVVAYFAVSSSAYVQIILENNAYF